MINNDEVLIMQLNLLVRKKPHMRSLSVASPSLGSQLAPPPCDVYESVEVAIREMNQWAEPLGYAVIRGPRIEKTSHCKKLGPFAIGERSLSCRWLQRIASALIEALKRLNAPSTSLFWRPMVRAVAYGL